MPWWMTVRGVRKGWAEVIVPPVDTSPAAARPEERGDSHPQNSEASWLTEPNVQQPVQAPAGESRVVGSGGDRQVEGRGAFRPLARGVKHCTLSALALTRKAARTCL